MHTRGQVHARSEEAKRRCYLLERRRGGGRAATARCADAEPAVPIPWGRVRVKLRARARVTAQRKLRVGTRAWRSLRLPRRRRVAMGRRVREAQAARTTDSCVRLGWGDRWGEGGCEERQHGEDKGEGERSGAPAASLTSRGETRGAPLNDAPPRRAAADAGSAGGSRRRAQSGVRDSTTEATTTGGGGGSRLSESGSAHRASTERNVRTGCGR